MSATRILPIPQSNGRSAPVLESQIRGPVHPGGQHTISTWHETDRPHEKRVAAQKDRTIVELIHPPDYAAMAEGHRDRVSSAVNATAEALAPGGSTSV